MKIAVAGCVGRMGRMVVAEILHTSGCTLAGAVARSRSPHLGADPAVVVGKAPSGLVIGDNAAAVFSNVDAVIDFSTPQAATAHAEIAAQTNGIHVIGVTGLSASQRQQLERSAQTARIVFAHNMSQGIAVLAALTEKVAATLGSEYDIEIVDTHHRHKADAPSGTALDLGEAAAQGRGIATPDLGDNGLAHRQPRRRRANEIGFASLRGGDVIGDHTVMFLSAGERIELTHRASDRSIYAKGSVRAALWCANQPPGLYAMADVLGC